MVLPTLDPFGLRNSTDALSRFGQGVEQFGRRSTVLDTPPIYSDYIASGLEPVESVNEYVSPTAFTGASNAYVGGDVGTGGNKYTDMFAQMSQGFGQNQQQFGQFGGDFGGTFGSVSNVGGAWSALDAHNNEIARAAQQYGAPANLIKAMINRESSGNWERDNRIAIIRDPNTGQVTRVKPDGSPDRMLPFVGIFETTAQSWGLDWNAMVGNKQLQIEGMAKILNGLSQKYGGYENAAKVYFGGEKALQGGFRDEFGMDSNTYGSRAISDWKMLDQKAGYTGGYGDGGVGTGVVQKALEFVGVPYVWGSLPGADADPWKTGWDCSAFVNWLDDKYGANEIPAGSHYQYQDSVDKGLIRKYSNPNEIPVGALLFWDTGNTAGGGANLNRAGHVSMYIGNGQMIHAANPGAGTIISNVADYMAMYPSLGYRPMSWSAAGQAQFQMPQMGSTPTFGNVFQKYLRKAA